MLRKLVLHHVGPTGSIGLDPVAPRLNLLTGDNGLGKSFILEAAWWALTRTWHGSPAIPTAPDARIIHHFDGDSGAMIRSESRWVPEGQYWKRKSGRPPNPGLVLYARVDGSFSVWDPARNYRLYARREGGEAESPAAYQFTSDEVLWGLRRHVTRGGRDVEETLCLGLIDEWREWLRAGDPRFELLTRLLALLGPDDEPLVPGVPVQPSLDDQRAIPTVRMAYGQDVPITYAPAGVRRMCKLAYLLAWALAAHEAESKRIGIEASRQVIMLVDEIETHLHPRWQRTILPSLLGALDRWQGGRQPEVQFIVATHSPLVLASVEPAFDEARDALWKLDLVDGAVQIERDVWHKRGDADRWLRSDVFDLKTTLSREAEAALQAAGALMRSAAPDPTAVAALDRRLVTLFSVHDPFFLRWRHHIGDLLPDEAE
ncbi:MAG: ATP-binding protein [Myxococcales bacterium]|nr:ATP-binding protein [Myxococcales bacterium]